MSTKFGQDPTFNSYHFSGVNSFNQDAIGAVSITGPGRVIDLNVFWAGDSQSGFNAANLMWNNGGSIEIQSSTYGAPSGTESIGGQILNTTSHNYFFTSTHNVNVGFWRDHLYSSVASVNTGGVDGITLATTSFPQPMTGSQSFNSAYGSLGKGAMRAYGHYTPSNIFVKRSGVWTAVTVNLKRGGVQSAPTIYVRRSGAWVQLQMVPVDQWDDKIEKKILIVHSDGSWEEGIIRDEGKVRFGNVKDKLHNWFDPRTNVPLLVPA